MLFVLKSIPKPIVANIEKRNESIGVLLKAKGTDG
jgi:hypothetical protein